MSSMENKSIYYPITISSLIILLNTALVYYIVNLTGTDFVHLTTDSCKILPYYYIEVFIITGLFLISLIFMCKCIIFHTIISVLYIIVFIGSTAFLYIEPDCMEKYKTTDNMKPFYYVIVCHYIISLLIIMVMLISYIYTILILHKSKTTISEPIVFNMVDEDEDENEDEQLIMA